jgi:hypothetical protein
LSKAYEQYTTIIGQNNDESKLEWARYRVCIALKQLGRWQDGVEATEVYLAKHGKSERAAEVRLMYAQGLLALGRSEDAQEQIGVILDGKAPESVRAMAMVERAQLQVIESKTPSTTPKATSIQIEEPSAETVELGETAPVEFIPVAADQSSPPAGVPAEQWASIRRAAEVGDIKTAQKLVGPYLDSKTLSEDQRAGLSVRYASLLKDLSHSKSQGRHN